jgi:uncharacterized protein (TIGR03437 family)
MKIDSRLNALFVFAALATAALAQTTTEFTATVTMSDDETNTQNRIRNFAGVGMVGTLGRAAVQLNTSRRLDDRDSEFDPMSLGITLAFNRLDSIFVATSGVPDPTLATAMVAGRVSSGTGAYADATGPAQGVRVTLNRRSASPPVYDVSLVGTATVGAQALDLAVTNVRVVQVATVVNVFDDESGAAMFTPLGAATVNLRSRPNTNRWDDSVSFIEGILTFTFSPSDSIQVLLIIDVDPKTNQVQVRPGVITGGTGRYVGASGTFRVLNIVESGDTATVTVSGSITMAGPSTPIITGVNTASGLNPISQNDWIEIKGTNLVPRDTPAGGMFWSNAAEFAQGRMPTELGGVGVKVNGKPAYVWWFCSAATTPACTSDQINVLTPLDDYEGMVTIEVTNGPATSGAFLRRKFPTTPTLLLFSSRGDAVATHADGSLVGPANLFPGASTPAGRGETISLWGVGFGLPTTPLVDGSSTQRGALPTTPACFLGGAAVQVAAALVSPGLSQFNVTVSENAFAGDNHFFCTFGDAGTPVVLVAVQ